MHGLVLLNSLGTDLRLWDPQVANSLTSTFAWFASTAAATVLATSGRAGTIDRLGADVHRAARPSCESSARTSAGLAGG